MNIHLVSFEDGITATGFRKFAAYAERINSDTHVSYVGTQSYRSLWKSFTRGMGNARPFDDAKWTASLNRSPGPTSSASRA